MVGVHRVTSSVLLLDVPDVTKPELTSAVLVALKLGNGRIGSLGGIEPNDTGTSGATARFVLDLRLLHISNCAEKLDKIFIARRPWQLFEVFQQKLGFSTTSRIEDQAVILTLRT